MFGRATITLGIGPHSSFVFLVFCVCLGIFGYCYFMLSVPVQLIAWEDRPRKDRCEEGC